MTFNLPKEESTSIPKWVLGALSSLSNASDIKVLMFLASRARYRRSAFGPGELSDELGIDYRTTTASLKRLGEQGYIVGANGVHALRGACTTVAQRLHKSTPTPQPQNAVQNVENENPTSPKDLEGLRRTLKDLKEPPLPPKGGARKTAATVQEKGTVTFPEILGTLAGFEPAWSDWLTYRKTRRATLNPATLTAQLTFLAAQPDPVAVIRQSIEKGWQGLFEVKGGAKGHRATPAANRLDEQDWDAVAAQVDADRDRFLTEGSWN